jgi:hypothetical protein
MWRLLASVVVFALVTGVVPRSTPGLAVVVNDQDADGCSDGEELGPNGGQGGKRNPNSYWDFYDVWTHPGSPSVWTRDKVVTVSGDILGVARRFGAMRPGGAPSKAVALTEAQTPPVSDTGYHAAFDRGAVVGSDPWDRDPPDGAITVSQDVLGVAQQFGHSCLGPEVAGSWSSRAAMPTPRTEVTSAFLNGVIYVMGGFPTTTNTNLVEAYDVASDSWSTPAPLPQALDHAGAAAVNGKVYVVGGYISLSQGTISSATYEYDPIANSWTTRAPMPLGRAAAATVEYNGKIYVLGGVGPQSTVPLVYDPAANTWQQLAPMSAAREHLTASAVGGKIYAVGGRQFTVQNVNWVEAYDVATNSWQALAPMPTARGGLASGALAGRVHVTGGEQLGSGGSTFPQHEVYDPVVNTWQPGPPLPTPRHGLTAQVVNGLLYVIGGGPTPGFSASGAVEVFALKP